MKISYRPWGVWSLAAALAAPVAAQNASEYVVQTPEVTRTIYISPLTQYVNVTQDDVVKFVSGDREFIVNFYNDSLRSFNLQQVAPPGVLDHPVTAYVARGSVLSGGNGNGNDN